MSLFCYLCYIRWWVRHEIVRDVGPHSFYPSLQGRTYSCNYLKKFISTLVEPQNIKACVGKSVENIQDVYNDSSNVQRKLLERRRDHCWNNTCDCIVDTTQKDYHGGFWFASWPLFIFLFDYNDKYPGKTNDRDTCRDHLGGGNVACNTRAFTDADATKDCTVHPLWGIQGKI